MEMKIETNDNAGASIVARPGLSEDGFAPKFKYEVVCRGADGEIKWTDTFENLVTTVGKNDLLDKYFKGSGYTAAWYVGLIGAASYTTGPAAGDTSASHGGWVEDQTYDEAARRTLTLGTPAAGSVDNSASKATFTISGTVTIKGAFVISISTKGGTTGILYSAGTFTGGDRSVVDNDTLDVTVTLTA